MEEEAVEEESGQNPHIRARHIKKRSLKNKALAVSFNEKDLKDYVTGFHKRKKKRRKEAQQQIQESDRRKRIELRKKRKLEREFAIYGGEAPTDASAGPDENGKDNEQEEENEPIASVSGTTMYDNGDVKVMVTTSAISHDEDLTEKPKTGVPKFIEGGPEKKKNNVPVSKKKPFKRVAKKRSRPKPQSKRDKRKAKNQSNKQ